MKHNMMDLLTKGDLAAIGVMVLSTMLLDAQY